MTTHFGNVCKRLHLPIVVLVSKYNADSTLEISTQKDYVIVYET